MGSIDLKFCILFLQFEMFFSMFKTDYEYRISNTEFYMSMPHTPHHKPQTNLAPKT